MTGEVKAAYVGVGGAILVTLLGWYLNRMTTHDTITELVTAHKAAIAQEKLRTELSRYQGIAAGISGSTSIDPEDSNEFISASPSEFIKIVSKYEASDKIFPLGEWHRFAKQHVRQQAQEDFGAISKRKAMLQLEIRLLVNSIPQNATSQNPASAYSANVDHIVQKLNELSTLYARYWGVIQSVTDADLILNKEPEPDPAR